MNTRTTNHAITVIIATAAAFLLGASVAISAQTTSIIPDRDVWEEPWVFQASGTQRTALAALGPLTVMDRPGTTVGPIPIRLDDGSTGALRVEARECGPKDQCTGNRDDCG